MNYQIDSIVFCVECDGGNGGHDNGHAQGHRSEQHDHVVGTVLQVQLVFLIKK
jgi:hypothetical protein